MISSWKDLASAVAEKQVENMTVVQHPVLFPKHPVGGQRGQYGSTNVKEHWFGFDTSGLSAEVSHGDEGCGNQTPSLLLFCEMTVLWALSWLFSLKGRILFERKMRFLPGGVGFWQQRIKQ